MANTLFEKIWAAHVVRELPDGTALIYIDRHLVHEVTSPQAFEGLRLAGRRVRRTDLSFATMDHNVPTTSDRMNIEDPVSRAQVEAMRVNCEEFGIALYDLGHDYQGIVHMIGPELGITLPGLTIVCGDSHTSTHGAFGALAFGIGTSEVEHVLVTQTLKQRKPRTFQVEFTGQLPPHVFSKDMVLKMIGTIGTAGGAGHVLEYCGDTIGALSMEARMTICNMSIEGGARAGLVAPDDVTFQYIAGQPRPFAPQGERLGAALDYWKTLPSDPGAQYDRSITIDSSRIKPQVTWGTNPGMVMDIDQVIPEPEKCLLEQGIFCAGFATRAGCGAQCVQANMPCRGCYGPPPNVVDQGAKIVSGLGSVIDSQDPEEVRKIVDQIPFPIGMFYRFGLSQSILRRRTVHEAN